MPENKSGTHLRTSRIRHRQAPGQERLGAPQSGRTSTLPCPLKLPVLMRIAAEATRNNLVGWFSGRFLYFGPDECAGKNLQRQFSVFQKMIVAVIVATISRFLHQDLDGARLPSTQRTVRGGNGLERASGRWCSPVRRGNDQSGRRNDFSRLLPPDNSGGAAGRARRRVSATRIRRRGADGRMLRSVAARS